MRVAVPQSGRWPGVALAAWLPLQPTEVTPGTPCDRPEEEDPITPHPSAVRFFIYVGEGFRFLLTVARNVHEIFWFLLTFASSFPTCLLLARGITFS